MDDDTIQDLKQFIAATVHQEVSGLKEDFSGLKQDVSFLRDEIKSTREILSARIDDIDMKLDTVIEATGEQFDDHENRITKLEAKTT